MSTSIDLPANTRTAMVAVLNASLADAIDLALAAKQAHWNVKDANFHALHALFDHVHAEAMTYVDTLAERAVAIGGRAHGSLRFAAKASRLPEYPLDARSGPTHVVAVAQSLADFTAHTRKVIDEAAAMGDQVTADVLTEVTRGADKLLWMVEAHKG